MKLLPLLQVARSTNDEASDLSILRQVEKAVVNSLDNFGTQSSTEQNRLIDFLKEIDLQLATWGIKEFETNERLQKAYTKVSQLDEETFFEKGAFQALRKLRVELWNSVESSN